MQLEFTKKQIKDRIKKTLNEYKDIFDLGTPSPYVNNIHLEVIKSKIEQWEALKLQLPKVSRDKCEGIKLKDGKGYISIEEKYQAINKSKFKKIQHVYKYMSADHKYLCTSTNNPGEIMTYGFHYDTDMNYFNKEGIKKLDHHPVNHLHVLHPVPRFKTIDDMALEEFFKSVKALFDGTDNPIFLKK